MRRGQNRDERTPLNGSAWSVVPSVDADPGGNLLFGLHAVSDPGSGANGFADISAVPGGGLWAVGVTSNKANNSAFIAYHC